VLQTQKAPVSRTAAEKRAHLLREIVETLLFIGLVIVISQFAIGSFLVRDTRMSPQLQPDERIVVNKWAYLFGGPSRGDVVVYYDPTNLAAPPSFGRVVAVPGDRVTVTPSEIQVDGVALKESYVNVPSGVMPNATVLNDLKLGSNDYYILNDSRLNAADSRSIGAVPRSDIIGKAAFVFWPVKSIRGISNFPDVYKGVSP
jgi:signal peptidase I